MEPLSCFFCDEKLDNFPHLAQRIEREQARVVAVAEMDRVSIVALRLHLGDPQRLGFRLTQHGQLGRRRGRRSTFLSASSTGAFFAQLADRVLAHLAVAPIDLEKLRGNQLQLGGLYAHLLAQIHETLSLAFEPRQRQQGGQLHFDLQT